MKKWKETETFLLFRSALTSSRCLCCQLRIEGVVHCARKKEVASERASAEAICPVCYEAVRIEAEKVKVMFPPFDSLISDRWVGFSFPAWNVIQGSPFRYFIPADEIDRGLMIQRAREKREVKDDGV